MRLFSWTRIDTVDVVLEKYSNIIGQNFLKPLDILFHCKGQDILDGEILKGMTGIKHSAITPTYEGLIMTSYPQRIPWTTKSARSRTIGTGTKGYDTTEQPGEKTQRIVTETV